MALLPYDDAPEWTHIILAYHDYEGPIRVELCTAAYLPGAPNNTDSVAVYEYDNVTGGISGIASGGDCLDSPLCQGFYRRALLSPAVMSPLERDMLLLRVLDGPNGHQSATLYAHPDHAPSLVKEVMPPVSWAVRVVLVATKECKAAYNNNMDNRKAQAVWQTGICGQEFDAARQECIDSGFMTKRRILTSRGRNIAGKTKLNALKRHNRTNMRDDT